MLQTMKRVSSDAATVRWGTGLNQRAPKTMLRNLTRAAAVSTLAAMLVAGCGGGGGSGSSTATPPAAPALELLVGLPITGYTSVDGTGTEARFNLPTGIVSDPARVRSVADSRASPIRKVTPT